MAMSPADQYDGKRGFGAFTFDGVQSLVLEQRRRQAAQPASSSTINTARRFGCA
jgi:hypothetical protein